MKYGFLCEMLVKIIKLTSWCLRSFKRHLSQIFFVLIICKHIFIHLFSASLHFHWPIISTILFAILTIPSFLTDVFNIRGRELFSAEIVTRELAFIYSNRNKHKVSSVTVQQNCLFGIYSYRANAYFSKMFACTEFA